MRLPAPFFEDGGPDFRAIAWRFRMGPFTLMDYIGNDVNYAVTESVWRACYYEPRYKPSFTQKRLTEAGYLGRKSGKGYYDYTQGAKNELPPVDDELEDNIFWRVLVMLINEAAEALYWGVASRDDIDLAMTKGVNYPKGLLKWADEVGIGSVVETMDRMFDEYREERYRCSTALRQMERQGWTFY
jgi:3-hydroxybutyryl-CoA dehydrogenase